MILGGALVACVAGPDSEVEHARGSALGEYVDVQGLQTALAMYANTALDPRTAGKNSPRNAALLDATFRAMRQADAGNLEPEDEQFLRSRVVPFAAALEKGRMVAQAFDSTCSGAAGGEVMPYVMQTAAQRSSAEPAWEGNTDAGFAQLFSGPQADLQASLGSRDCSESRFASSVVRASIEQAFSNHVQIRATLVRGDVDWMASDPAGFASAEVGLLPSALGSFRANATQTIETAARAAAEALDAEMAHELRLRTVAGFDAVLQDIQTSFDTAARSDDLIWALPSAGERWCREALRAYSSRNLLALSDTVATGLCTPRGTGNYRPNSMYRPGESDMAAIAADLQRSVSAYLDKLATAWTDGWGRNDPWTTIYHAADNNLAGVAATIASAPACTYVACDYLARIQAQHESEARTDNLVMWGAAVVGIVAVVSGVGLLAVGALAVGGVISAGAAAAATTVLGFVATAASVTGLVVSLLAVPYLAYRGLSMHYWASQDLAALAVSGADPAAALAARDRAFELMTEALINGIFAVVEVAQVVRALRVRRTGLLGDAELDAARQKLGRAGGVSEEAQRFIDAAERGPRPFGWGADDRLEWIDDLASETNMTRQRVAELAADPAHGGKVRPGSVREARSALYCEREGLIRGPVTRSADATADFVDAAGQKWDVKAFTSWSGDAATQLDQIRSELAVSQNVIVDTTNMTRADAQALVRAVESQGLRGNVLFYPDIALPNPGIGGLLIALTARGAGGAPGEADPQEPGNTPEPDPADETEPTTCEDSCDYAADGYCDDGREGSDSDFCEPGTDCTDCETDAGGPSPEPTCEDTCDYAWDGTCDDGREGSFTDLCDPGTDCTDCEADVEAEEEEEPACADTCEYAFDGTCDDGGDGAYTELCAYGTDCLDCGARS